ncbi:poly-gamma-glutamate hydrolase family protein [Bacillus sp. ISL-51]|uniref:poly-gamma-glutamate hydrolase family protein n=1 Tax=Bacteria TaxID=2 RepID=UPI001BE5538D|nr:MULTISPECIES: poly-gamma-glutamate hydrolase family protein [Bacteria]MBT2575220.1 poly-gamma-glutamate hydrolase family protein [Bacillus sp. ISL-51]MBT2633514.1 poly-gamma-glutamate hydrolase family protein [Bacillus sp. ISL-26]MBT2714050.1 poly-gamma-glutamate hydrolase family protein [Pseudomonas sp. ISL-88]
MKRILLNVIIIVAMVLLIRCVHYASEPEPSTSDTYLDFKSLAEHEDPDDYHISYNRQEGSQVLIMSPHGGRIEGGVSEIVRSFSDDFSTYLFEGLKAHDNQTLHITSTNFDEPAALKSIKQHRYVIAVHGYKGDGKNTLVGGSDRKRAAKLVKALERSGFSAELASSKSGLAGVHAENINNQGKTGLSIQLEISREQREAFFDNFDYREREYTKTDEFYRFVRTIKRVINQGYSEQKTRQTSERSAD